MGIQNHLTCRLRNLYAGQGHNGLVQNWERSTSRLYPALCNSFGKPLTISVPSYFSHLRSGSKRGLLCAPFAQSRPTLFDPMDCIPPGSSAHGISQAGILEWTAISYSMGSSRPRDRTHVFCIGRQIVYHCAIWEAPSFV